MLKTLPYAVMTLHFKLAQQNSLNLKLSFCQVSKADGACYAPPPPPLIV